MNNDEELKAQVDFWKSHPGADEIRIAIKHLIKLQQDIMELRYKGYLYDLMDIACWINELLADDINVFRSNRIFESFILLRDDITVRIEAKRKRSQAQLARAAATAAAGLTPAPGKPRVLH